MISGLVKTSLIDYPNKLSCVVFLSGCNYRCPYCHNSSLVKNQEARITLHDFNEFLNNRHNVLNGVVITGGEPTIYPHLFEIVHLIKRYNYQIKIDTNGSKPYVIEELIKSELVDYIAMDIKGILSNYSFITRSKSDVSLIEKSINLIMNSSIDYEFRTTVIKGIHTINDFHQIGKLMYNAKRFFIQPYRYTKNQLDPIKYSSFSDEELSLIKSIMTQYVKEVVIR